MNKETVMHSMELLCAHLAEINSEVDKHGFTCCAQVHDMAKTLHGIKSAHAVVSHLA